MTEREAIERLKDHFEVHDDGRPTPYLDEAVSMAIAALEKQIPKKINCKGDGYWKGQPVYDTWICPCCEEHYEVDYDNYDYCPNCGQHLENEWRINKYEEIIDYTSTSAFN